MHEHKVIYRSESDEIANHRQGLQDCFDLFECQGARLKVFKTYFSPPGPDEGCNVVMFDSCKANIDPSSDDIQNLPIILREPVANLINEKIAKLRASPIRNTKVLLIASIGGGIFLSIIAILLAIMVSYWLVIFFVLFYLLMLFLTITFHSKRGKLLEKKYLFNLALIINNANNNKICDNGSML